MSVLTSTPSVEVVLRDQMVTTVLLLTNGEDVGGNTDPYKVRDYTVPLTRSIDREITSSKNSLL